MRGTVGQYPRWDCLAALMACKVDAFGFPARCDGHDGCADLDAGPGWGRQPARIAGARGSGATGT